MFSSLRHEKEAAANGVDMNVRRLGCMMGMFLIMAALLVASLFPAAPARGQEEEQPATGPIDPAVGSWIIYKGEIAAPDQPAPTAFSVRIDYEFTPGAAPEDMNVNARLKELDALGQATAERIYTIQTIDRFYNQSGGEEEGYWLYWLTPGLEAEDAATVGSGTELKAEGVEDYDFKDGVFRVVKMRGEGLELLVEQRTGLVFRIVKDGGETLQIDDTNMLAQYLAWGRSPDDRIVGSRLESLASEYPDLVEVSSLGKSAKGRDIWLAHITDFTASEEKRAVIIDAAIEGDAPEGSAFVLDLMDEMVRLAEEDDLIAGLLDSLNIYVLPLVNPDGLQRWLAMPDPAENAVFNSQAPRNGRLVNVNRNFDIKWEEGVRDPASPDFGGPAPFSETESQALRKPFEDIPVDLSISLHTGEDLISAPWNWSESSTSNPEWSFYQGILSELSAFFPYPTAVGAPEAPFTGSSTDWAYEGNGASSPICFDLYLHELDGIEAGEGGEGGLLSIYSPQRETILYLMENIQSYLGVNIDTPEPRAEVNVPIDVTVEISVSGKRALPDTEVRLILPDDSGLKLATMSEKEVQLGDLEPGSTAEVSWNLEGKTNGTFTAEVILTSSYPDYARIPGTYGTEMEITVSSQRTWLVLVLLTLLVLAVLGMILLSMRKHRKGEKPEKPEPEKPE
jgi:hypothetical protein